MYINKFTIFNIKFVIANFLTLPLIIKCIHCTATETKSEWQPSRSEIWNLTNIHYSSIADFKSLTSNKSTTVTDSYPVLEPSFLVGKQVRLYCPVDNAYHIGRIADWRGADDLSSTSSHVRNEKCKNGGCLFHGTSEFARSEFLGEI